MYRNTVEARQNNVEMISSFYGYNHNLIQNLGEFWDTENISFDNFPVLSPRKPVIKYSLDNKFKSANDINAIIHGGKMAYFDGNGINYADEYYELNEEQKQRGNGKQTSLLTFGTNILLFPYNVYIDTAEKIPKLKDLGFDKCVLSEDVTVKNCSIDGKSIYERVYVGNSAKSPNGQFVGGYIGSYTDYAPTGLSSFCVFKMNKNGELEPYANYSGEYKGQSINRCMATTNDVSDFNFSKSPNYSNNEYKDGDIIIDASMQIGDGWQGYRTNKFYLSTNEGQLYPLDDIVISNYEDIYAYWIDTSDSEPIFKMYSNSSDTWVSLTSNYAIIDGISKDCGIKNGDSIRIEYNGENPLKHSDEDTEFYYVYAYIEGENTDSIVIRQLIFDNDLSTKVLSNKTHFIKEIPDLDYVISAGNRVWGCKYGFNKKGELINQVYASSQSDASNWNVFTGTDADSFAGTLSFDGEFTGAVAMNGYPYFFKENAIFCVYGAYPSAFQMYTYEYQGCEFSSSKSIAVVDGNIFFKSPNGICVFDGSNCINIGDNLGNVEYRNASGGGANGHYYISMLDSNNVPATFMFDIQKQMWIKLNKVKFDCFVTNNSGIILAVAGNDIVSIGRSADAVFGTKGEEEKIVEWYAETGAIDYSYPNKKKISNINIRVLADLDACLELYIQYDSNGMWELADTISGTGIPKTTNITIIPQECDHYAFKFVGKGNANVISISNNMSVVR